MHLKDSILIAGHSGLIGSSIVRALKTRGFANLIYAPRDQVDYLDPSAVKNVFAEHRPKYVFHAAGKVSGIAYNASNQVEMLSVNLHINLNLIEAAFEFGTEKFLYLGSSCLYPKSCPQPMREEFILSGNFEPSNEGYAIAKLAGLKLCEKYYLQFGRKYISAIPANTYGPNDNFDISHSHVIPALIRKFHEAKILALPCVEVWGTGRAIRDFIYVDDVAENLIHMMEQYSGVEPINIGSGEGISIRQLTEIIKDVVGFTGLVKFNSEYPDGMLQKVLDIGKANDLGLSTFTTMKSGIQKTYNWALNLGKLS